MWSLHLEMHLIRRMRPLFLLVLNISCSLQRERPRPPPAAAPLIAAMKTVSLALIFRIREWREFVISLTIFPMVSSSIASANSSIGPPALKNLPDPVRITDLHEGSSSRDSICLTNGWKFSGLNVFLEASDDIVRIATPPS